MNLKNYFKILLLCCILCGCNKAVRPEKPDMEWWREARFGMFIHLGLYSVAAGQWDGKDIDGIGEWIQNFAKIPNSDYEKLAADFTLANYNPEEWVMLAKQAGARYIVFTTKHHEGFCLYPSDVSDFDIERTPYKKDPLKELVEACRKHDMKIGFYYSHRQDWREEEAAVMKNEYDGHYGKPKSEVKPDLDSYIRKKALPQMRELLTRYGKIDLLWYDTPFDLTKEQSQMFVDVVRKLQPECIINGRVGFNLGDYGPLGDNEMPCARVSKDLEMVATMNHTWGYKKNDHDWKSPKDILCSLIECTSRGVNYMINIGPKADGSVPQPSIDIMKFIGNWMRVNSESIYGATANPFNDNFPWGYVTSKGNALYLHLLRRPADNRIILKGMLSPIEKTELLASGRVLLSSEEPCSIAVPNDLDYEQIPVIKLTCKEPIRISDANYMNENIISIPVANGIITPGTKDILSIAEGGNTENFNAGTGKLRMKFEVDSLGEYTVRVFTSRHWRKSFAEGAQITLKIGDTLFDSVVLKKSGELDNVRKNSYPESWSDIGTVTFNKEGTQEVELSVNKTGTFSRLGFFGEDIQNESENNIRFLRIELIRQ